jgi:hypothetical protein
MSNVRFPMTCAPGIGAAPTNGVMNFTRLSNVFRRGAAGVVIGAVDEVGSEFSVGFTASLDVLCLLTWSL